MEERHERALAACELMLRRAYCKYSQFPVAAVLVTATGELFAGCNVENASYGLAICAERVAACKAVSEGHTRFEACYVLAGAASGAPVGPCGACRQFLAEFNLDMTVFLVDSERRLTSQRLSDLLPGAFTGSQLPEGRQ